MSVGKEPTGLWTYDFDVQRFFGDIGPLINVFRRREAGYFATAPFVGAIASVLVYREMPGPMEIAGALQMGAGVIGLLRERHSHVHVHDLWSTNISAITRSASPPSP